MTKVKSLIGKISYNVGNKPFEIENKTKTR